MITIAYEGTNNSPPFHRQQIAILKYPEIVTEYRCLARHFRIQVHFARVKGSLYIIIKGQINCFLPQTIRPFASVEKETRGRLWIKGSKEVTAKVDKERGDKNG